MVTVSSYQYVANKSTVIFSPIFSFTTTEKVEKSLTVIVMFSSFWAIGLLLVSCVYRRSKFHHLKYSFHQQQLEDQLVEVNDGTVESAKEILGVYFDEVIPKVFMSQPAIIRFVNEVFGQHRFSSFVDNRSKIENDSEEKYVIGIKLLTTQCMMMFMMVLFYDFQYPRNDGSCVSLMTKSDCLTRRSPFDHTITYCSWLDLQSSSTSGFSQCQYNAINSSTTRVFIITIVLISFCTGLLVRPIDILFHHLLAPILRPAEKKGRIIQHITMTHKLAHKVASVSINHVFLEAKARLNEYRQYIWNVRGEYQQGNFVRGSLKHVKSASIDNSFNLRSEENFKNFATKLAEDYEHNFSNDVESTSERSLTDYLQNTSKKSEQELDEVKDIQYNHSNKIKSGYVRKFSLNDIVRPFSSVGTLGSSRINRQNNYKIFVDDDKEV
eukprot:gene12249-16422_t